MLIIIPEELQPYVRISPKSGLVHSDDLPDDLLPLFNKTKLLVKATQEQRQKELAGLLVDE